MSLRTKLCLVILNYSGVNKNIVHSRGESVSSAPGGRVGNKCHLLWDCDKIVIESGVTGDLHP